MDIDYRLKKMCCVYSNDQINRIAVPKLDRSGAHIKTRELIFEQKRVRINQNYTDIKVNPD